MSFFPCSFLLFLVCANLLPEIAFRSTFRLRRWHFHDSISNTLTIQFSRLRISQYCHSAQPVIPFAFTRQVTINRRTSRRHSFSRYTSSSVNELLQQLDRITAGKTNLARIRIQRRRRSRPLLFARLDLFSSLTELFFVSAHALFFSSLSTTRWSYFFLRHPNDDECTY